MKICPICAGPMDPGACGTRRYCSSSCRQRAYERRNGRGLPLGNNARIAAQKRRLSLAPELPPEPRRERFFEPPEPTYWAWPKHVPRATDRPPFDEGRARRAAAAAFDESSQFVLKAGGNG